MWVISSCNPQVSYPSGLWEILSIFLYASRICLHGQPFINLLVCAKVHERLARTMSYRISATADCLTHWISNNITNLWCIQIHFLKWIFLFWFKFEFQCTYSNWQTFIIGSRKDLVPNWRQPVIEGCDDTVRHYVFSGFVQYCISLNICYEMVADTLRNHLQ